MKVLHVLASLEPETGGPARVVPALCEALASTDADVTLCVTGRDIAETTVAGKALSYTLKFLPKIPGTRELPSPTGFRDLKDFVRSHDIVHLQGVWHPLISITARSAARMNVPYVISPLGMLRNVALERSSAKKKLYYRLVDRRLFRGAAGFHFLTDVEAEEASAFVNGNRSAVIPSGVGGLPGRSPDDQFYRKFPALRGRRFLVFIGRLHWSKGLDLQAEAIAQLASTHPDLLWVIAGPDGGYYAELKRLLTILGIADRHVYVGEQDEVGVVDLVSRGVALLLTSRHEGQSMAMNEAWALGTPVIGTDTTKFPLAERYRAAIFVPRSAPAIADAIRRVVGDTTFASTLSTRGLDLVRNELQWNIVADRMKNFYADVQKITRSTASERRRK